MNTLKDFVNWKLSHADKVAEAEGYPLIMENCKKNKKMKQHKIYGNSVQVGENLYDASKVTPGIYLDDNGVEVPSGDGTTSLSDFILVDDRTNYIINVYNPLGSNSVTLRINFFDAEQIWVSQKKYSVKNGETTERITVPENVSYIRVSYYNKNLPPTVYQEKPTPENPIEVHSVGEKSVNLTDGILEVGGIANATGQNNNSTDYFRSVNYTLIIPNTVYTITASKPIQFVYFYDKDYNFINLSGENARTFTTPENCEYIRYRIIRNGSIENETVDKVMLVQGTTIIPYEPYGKYKIPVVQRGKNLFKPTRVGTGEFTVSNANGNVSNSYGTVIDSCDLTDNKVIVTQTPNTNYIPENYRNGFITIKHDKLVTGNKYKISFDIEITDNPLNADYMSLYPSGQYNGERQVKITQNKQRVSGVFTAISRSSNYYPYIEIRVCGMSFIASNFMITEDGYEADYEPYIEPITTNIFLSEPLRKIGDYVDHIDFKGGKVVRNIRERIFTGSEFLSNIDSIRGSFAFEISNLNLDSSKIYIYCNKLESIPWNTLISNNKKEPADYTLGIARQNHRIRFTYSNEIEHVSANRDVCKAQLKAWYDEGSPMCVIYVNPPTEEQISCTLPKLNAKTTIIEVDTSLAPSNAYGKYIKR